MTDEQSQRRLSRQFWGISPTAAEQMLATQAERFAQEIQQFKEAIAQLVEEEKVLVVECQELEGRIREARTQRDRLQKGLERQRSMATLQALVLAREMAEMDREHGRQLIEMQERRETYQTEIELRRESLHRWVRSLLQSVAERDKSADGAE